MCGKIGNTLLKVMGSIVIYFLYIVIGVIIFFVISSKLQGGGTEIFGYQLKTVLSGSMEPGIKTGSIIAVKTGGEMDRFKENDIVTYKENKYQLVTHRIVEVIMKENQLMYRTKGDNNDGPDPTLLLPENIVAEYKGFHVPYIGYLIEFTKTKNGIMLLFFIPGIYLIFLSLLNVRTIFVENSKKNDVDAGGDDLSKVN